MPPDVCQLALDGIESLGVTHVSLTGGEPTLHPLFWSILESLSRRAVAISINTNGSTLSRSHVERLARLKVCSVCISVDSIDPTDLRSLGQPSSSSTKVCELIGNLKDVGLAVITKSVLVPGINCSVSQAAALSEHLDLLGVDFQAFSDVIPLGRARNYRLPLEALDVAAFLGRRGKKDNFSSGVWRSRGDSRASRRLQPDLPETACGVGTELTSILPDGTVAPCIQMPDVVAGNLTEGTLEEIWESARAYEPFRCRNLLRADTCRVCSARQLCRGGCKAKARAYGGSMACPDPWSCAVFGQLETAQRTLLGDGGT